MRELERQGRIILMLADAMHISEEEALVVFIHSTAYQDFEDPYSNLEAMSDQYFVDEILAEMDSKL